MEKRNLMGKKDFGGKKKNFVFSDKSMELSRGTDQVSAKFQIKNPNTLECLGGATVTVVAISRRVSRRATANHCLNTGHSKPFRCLQRQTLVPKKTEGHTSVGGGTIFFIFILKHLSNLPAGMAQLHHPVLPQTSKASAP